MASAYGYITVADLEAYTGINYESTSGVYTDAFVEAQISQAERAVNTECIVAPGATDAAIFTTLVLSERFMRNVMFIDGLASEVKQSVKVFYDYIIGRLLKVDKYSNVSIVPMSGAAR